MANKTVVQTGTVKMMYGSSIEHQRYMVVETKRMYQGKIKIRYEYHVQEINSQSFLKMASGPTFDGLLKHIVNTTVNLLDINKE